MPRPAPKEVYQNPSDYLDFLSIGSDDKFENQHFERKEVGLSGQPVSKAQLKTIREGITKTISAFANSNREGGLLVLGISSDGTIVGIDNLTEIQLNGLLDFDTLLNNHTADAKQHPLTDDSGNEKTIILILVSYASNSICETPEQNPKAWVRRGPQNISMNYEMRDRMITEKKISNFEDIVRDEFSIDDVDHEILSEFRKSCSPEIPEDFTTERVLKEVGAIKMHEGKYHFTNAGVLFFHIHPQRIIVTSYIRLLRFDVPSTEFRDRGLPTFEREFKGPITKQIRNARLFLKDSAFFKSFQRRKPNGGFLDEPEFPSTVIDEAIVNSVAHRDYQTRVPIECEAYHDAFIIKNPGRMLQRDLDLPDEFSLSNTLLDSTPRNARLFEWLKTMKDPSGTEFVKALSEGTKQILKEMRRLNLPAPTYKLRLNETLLKLENNQAIRQAAIHAASQIKSTEFANLFPLWVRNGDSPVDHQVLNDHYSELLKTLRDALRGNNWYIDRFSFSRIVAHKQRKSFNMPVAVNSVLKIFPAFEFQIRQYFGNFYLCVDYKCQVHNVQSLDILSQQFDKDQLIHRRCIAKDGDWREGKIIQFDSEFANIFFLDTKSEHRVESKSVVPAMSLDMIKISLQKLQINFDLDQVIKRHSLSSKRGSARERVEWMEKMVDDIADTIFPLPIGDLYVEFSKKPLRLIEQGNVTQNTFLVNRLIEPKVMFREFHQSSDVRTGIMEHGAYDSEGHDIEIIPICLTPMVDHMKTLIARLIHGKIKYQGAERTFLTRFEYSSVVGIDQPEDSITEIHQLFEKNPSWEGDPKLNRIFLVHVPEQGYVKDDETSPYYRIKRLLLERGVPSQMINTPTLQDPDWKDLNLALNIVAKCGVRPWVLPDSIPDADFFIGLSYTMSSDGTRIMGFANVFNDYGRWEFYSGNTSYFDYEERTAHLAELVRQTLKNLNGQFSEVPRVSLHYSAKLSNSDRNSILKAAQEVLPDGIFSFVRINSHHNVRFYDHRSETDGSMRRGSYVEVAPNKIYLSTTGYNTYRPALGTPKPLEVSLWTEQPDGSRNETPDLGILATQVLNLTKLNWASTDSFCGQPITLKYASNIAYLTAAFLRQSEPFKLHPVLEKTPWFI